MVTEVTELTEGMWGPSVTRETQEQILARPLPSCKTQGGDLSLRASDSSFGKRGELGEVIYTRVCVTRRTHGQLPGAHRH